MKEMSQSVGSTLTASTGVEPSRQQAPAHACRFLCIVRQYLVLVKRMGLRVRPLSPQLLCEPSARHLASLRLCIMHMCGLASPDCHMNYPSSEHLLNILSGATVKSGKAYKALGTLEVVFCSTEHLTYKD